MSLDLLFEGYFANVSSPDRPISDNYNDVTFLWKPNNGVRELSSKRCLTQSDTRDCPRYLLFRINAVDAAYRITITTKGHWDVVLLVTADDQLRVGIESILLWTSGESDHIIFMYINMHRCIPNLNTNYLCWPVLVQANERWRRLQEIYKNTSWIYSIAPCQGLWSRVTARSPVWRSGPLAWPKIP